MYAVILTGGKQYKVSSGMVLEIEKLAVEVGQKYNFEQVLLVADGENVSIGQPYISGVCVSAEILAQAKDKKVVIFKYKRKTGYRRKTGHRQLMTIVKIDQILMSNQKSTPKSETLVDSEEVVNHGS